MKRSLVAIVGLCLLASPILAAKKDEAYLISEREFKRNYKTIVLAPVDADALLEMPDSAKAMIEQEITARLQKRGYTVIPSSVLENIRKTMEEQVGGTVNDGGQVDNAKMRAVRNHALRELWFRETFDAVATMRVSITKVPMESDRVQWDGAKAKLRYEGRSKKYSASISVSSVSLAMYDSTGKPIYLFYGGLEPLMYRDAEQLEPLSADEFFKDDERVRKAAQIAVSPI